MAMLLIWSRAKQVFASAALRFTTFHWSFLRPAQACPPKPWLLTLDANKLIIKSLQCNLNSVLVKRI